MEIYGTRKLVTVWKTQSKKNRRNASVQQFSNFRHLWESKIPLSGVTYQIQINTLEFITAKLQL